MPVSQDHPQVSIVIPLYNEAGCLETNVTLIENYLRTVQLDYEVVLVNDGSSDATKAFCDAIVNQSPPVRLISYPVNRGKGFAVKTGVLDALGEYIIFIDADLAVPVHFIGACLKRLEAGRPIVIGSRHLPGSSFKVREDPLRQFLGEIFRRFSRLSLSLKVSDITCGLKGFHKKAAVDIFSRSKIDRWGYDAEIIFLAQKLGYRIAEIPVDWYHSFDSKVRVGIASIKTLTEMFQISYYHLTDSYDLGCHGKRRI
ncbi:MAG: glycosyltransferase [Desulfobacterales bacterium]|nr:glycosyltransferase [Desulfobacterales bacterium]